MLQLDSLSPTVRLHQPRSTSSVEPIPRAPQSAIAIAPHQRTSAFSSTLPFSVDETLQASYDHTLSLNDLSESLLTFTVFAHSQRSQLLLDPPRTSRHLTCLNLHSFSMLRLLFTPSPVSLPSLRSIFSAAFFLKSCSVACCSHLYFTDTMLRSVSVPL